MLLPIEEVVESGLEEEGSMPAAPAAVPPASSQDADFPQRSSSSQEAPRAPSQPAASAAPPPSLRARQRPTIRQVAFALIIFLGVVVGVASILGVRRQYAQPFDVLSSDTSTTDNDKGGIIESPSLSTNSKHATSGPTKINAIGSSSSSSSSSSTTTSTTQAEHLLPGLLEIDKYAYARSKGGLADGQGIIEEEMEENFIAIHGCTPQTGPQLRLLVETTECSVITLMPGMKYVLDDEIIVRRPVVIMGRPLSPPIIDAHFIYRAFLVEEGGKLDLRFVEAWRGVPAPVIQDIYDELKGGVAWIRRGGVGVFLGCVMLVHEDEIGNVLFTRNPELTIRIYGGFLLLESGTLRVTDCHFLISRPGVLWREVYTVGGYVLVVAGTTFITGSTMTANFLFVSVVGVGNFIAVLGGNAVVTGTSFSLNAGFCASQGVGLLLFVGGGTSVLTGVVNHGNILFVSFFGAGFGLWTGGGVSIMTGMVYSSSVCMSFSAGVALNNGLGAGIVVKTGVVQSGTVIYSALAMLGVATFVGVGTVVYTDCVWSRVTSIGAYWGAGGSLYLGAGVATLTNCVSMAISVIVYVAAAGGDVCVMAGWLTMVNNYFFKYVVIATYHGQGVDMCVVAGGALLVRCGYTGTPAIVGTSRNLFNVYVSGNFINLNATTDVVLATHKRFEVWESEEKRGRDVEEYGGRGLEDGREEGEERGPTQKVYELMGSIKASSVIMRHVGWKEEGIEEFKVAFRESVGSGGEGNDAATAASAGANTAAAPAAAAGGGGDEFDLASFVQWPQHLRQLQHHRRVLEGQEAPSATASHPALDSITTDESSKPITTSAAATVAVAEGQALSFLLPAAAAFNTSLYMPLFPYSPILVPLADPRTTSIGKVFLASRLDRCQACDITGPGFDSFEVAREGEQQQQQLVTAAHFHGQGTEGCDFKESCGTLAEEEEEEWRENEEQMWMSDPERGIQPNTSLAVLDLLVTYTPSSFASSTFSSSSEVEPQHVLAAVNQTMQRLGLSQRLLLRVVSNTGTPPYTPLGTDDNSERGRLQQVWEEEHGPCSSTAPFRAYVVTDQRQVAGRASNSLRQSATASLLTKALQEQNPSVCQVSTTRVSAFHVPSLNASALVLQPSGNGRKEGGKVGGYMARVIGSAAKAMPQIDLGGVVVGLGEHGLQHRSLQYPLQHEPQLPTAAVLMVVDGKEEEEEEERKEEGHGGHVGQVVMGQRYRVSLHDFPPGRLLSLRLVPKVGPSTLIGLTLSSSSSSPFSAGRNEWLWVVSEGKHAEGEYFIEIASQAKDTFSYTHAFELVA